MSGPDPEVLKRVLANRYGVFVDRFLIVNMVPIRCAVEVIGVDVDGHRFKVLVNEHEYTQEEDTSLGLKIERCVGK